MVLEDWDLRAVGLVVMPLPDYRAILSGCFKRRWIASVADGIAWYVG